MALLVIALLATALGLLCYITYKHLKYWEERGVKCLTPTIAGAIKSSIFNDAIDMYTCYPEEPYVGITRVHSKAICVRDPDLIRLVLAKDFAYFHDRAVRFNEKRDALSASLTNIEGKRWKALRSKLTPAFSSGKLKAMFPLIRYCVDEMVDIVSESYADKPTGVDLFGIISRCTTDIILSCAFNVQADCMKNENSIYPQMALKATTHTPLKTLEHVFFLTFPFLEKYFPPTKSSRESSEFFIALFEKTVREREKSGTKRNDFIDLLMEIYKNGKLSDAVANDEGSDSSIEFTFNMMVSQAFSFFVAGSDTSSSAVSCAVFELANNIHIQDKLWAEIDGSIQRHGGLNYDEVLGMPYLDQVVSETLRKYSFKVLARKVTRPYRMPDGRVTLPVGMRVYINIRGLHNDPKYFPEPEKFDPERFTPEAKEGRHKYVYIPFGAGPRSCIGLRFGLLQLKITLATLVSQFEFRPKLGIPYPPVISSKKIVASLEHGATVLIYKRKPKA